MSDNNFLHLNMNTKCIEHRPRVSHCVWVFCILLFLKIITILWFKIIHTSAAFMVIEHWKFIEWHTDRTSIFKIISENTCHSHQLSSVLQWNCHTWLNDLRPSGPEIEIPHATRPCSMRPKSQLVVRR